MKTTSGFMRLEAACTAAAAKPVLGRQAATSAAVRDSNRSSNNKLGPWASKLDKQTDRQTDRQTDIVFFTELQ